MESKAMVLETFNQPLRMRGFPVPDLKEGEALVRIEAAGVCGSDVHMWEGRDPRLRLPMIPGHEGAGEIVKSTEKKGMSTEDLLKRQTKSYGTGE
jgi:D-arabinose 1-dehydrogenase-like Zn-dependent alcohol dehydrogenase